jgi:predicted nucleotide-binding protein (sugar kinase/HSP70/actin superfamily)
VVLVGRAYNIYDPGLNINIPAKLRDQYGIDVLPMDFLPYEGIDVKPFHENMFWNYGRKILQTAAWVSGQTDMHLIYITNFKCGPDSYIKHFVRDAVAAPYLTLQFDEHSNDAGALTRCEAYLQSKGVLESADSTISQDTRRHLLSLQAGKE